MNSDNRIDEENEPVEPEALSRLAGEAGLRAVKAAIRSAGEATGVSFDLLYNMARRESALDPSAKAKTSSAAGLFQFIEQTWLGAVKAHGAKHGLAEAATAITKSPSGKFTVADDVRRKEILNLRFDAAKAAALAGELVRENQASLERRLGRAVDAAEIYAAHFLGPAGAVKLLTAAPESEAAALLPGAAAANRPVFYDGVRPRSCAEVIASIAKSMGLGPVSAAPARRAIAPDAADAPLTYDLEIKSADAGRRLVQWSVAATGLERLRPGEISVDPASETQRATIGLSRLFALREEILRPTLAPLALAALQALDPTRIGDSRDRP